MPAAMSRMKLSCERARRASKPENIQKKARARVQTDFSRHWQQQRAIGEQLVQRAARQVLDDDAERLETDAEECDHILQQPRRRQSQRMTATTRSRRTGCGRRSAISTASAMNSLSSGDANETRLSCLTATTMPRYVHRNTSPCAPVHVRQYQHNDTGSLGGKRGFSPSPIFFGVVWDNSANRM